MCRTMLAVIAVAFGLALSAEAAEISGPTARLAAPDPAARVEAAWSLGDVGHEARDTAPALVDAAIVRDLKAREAAVRTIGLVASAEEATRRHDSTTEFAHSGEFPRAGWAARRMARVSSARREMAALALAPLLESPGDREEGVNYAAARAFAGIAIAANNGASEMAALTAIRRRACAAPRQAVGPPVGLLADEEMTVRWNAARALAGFGAEAQTALAEALADDNAAIRAAAAVGLGEMGTESVPALLERARGDADPGVRAAAESALAGAAAAAAR